MTGLAWLLYCMLKEIKTFPRRSNKNQFKKFLLQRKLPVPLCFILLLALKIESNFLVSPRFGKYARDANDLIELS